MSPPKPSPSESYQVSGDTLGTILLKGLGALAGVAGFVFGVVGYYARRKVQRQQQALLTQVQLQQSQLLNAFEQSKNEGKGKASSRRNVEIEMETKSGKVDPEDDDKWRGGTAFEDLWRCRCACFSRVIPYYEST